MTEFKHYHSAHCESGAVSSLLTNNGFAISEAALFGISGAIFFVHFPFIKLFNIPMTSYRDAPGSIVKRTPKLLDFKIKVLRYRNEDKAMKDLDIFLSRGKVLGLQTNAYWLSYFPESMRIHFNIHNIIVYGKDNDNYLISDPVSDHVTVCPEKDLKKARFSKGVLAPKGKLYYIESNPVANNLKKAFFTGITHACKRMLYIPLPYCGVKGIKYLSRVMLKWPDKLKKEHLLQLYVGNVVRMQEEVGTGGAGFRFMYASFLQEASDLFKMDEFNIFSEEMTSIGDKWREFAISGARFCKNKSDLNSLNELSAILEELSFLEKEFFSNLLKFVTKHKKSMCV